MTNRATRPIQAPFQRFFQTESVGGSVLLLCAIAAVALANSPWANEYQELLTTPLAIQFGAQALTLTVQMWINDGLMAIFFLLVGLEIKRELIAGELASPPQAALPIAGALGGMLLPASFYWLVTTRTSAAKG